LMLKRLAHRAMGKHRPKSLTQILITTTTSISFRSICTIIIICLKYQARHSRSFRSTLATRNLGTSSFAILLCHRGTRVIQSTILVHKLRALQSQGQLEVTWLRHTTGTRPLIYIISLRCLNCTSIPHLTFNTPWNPKSRKILRRYSSHRSRLSMSGRRRSTQIPTCPRQSA